MQHHKLPDIIRPRNLKETTSLSLSTCRRLENDPTSGFPKRIRLSPGAVGYYRYQIEEYLASRKVVVKDASESATATITGAKRGRKPKNNGSASDGI
jgi:predicted DNA-binding transcriptional regulator AlpA